MLYGSDQASTTQKPTLFYGIQDLKENVNIPNSTKDDMINRSPLTEFFDHMSDLINPQIDKKTAKVIDTYRFKEGDFTYKQTVYRLKDHTIYVETEVVQDDELRLLRERLKQAVEDQMFEDAAKLRDEIKERLA